MTSIALVLLLLAADDNPIININSGFPVAGMMAGDADAFLKNLRVISQGGTPALGTVWIDAAGDPTTAVDQGNPAATALAWPVKGTDAAGSIQWSIKTGTPLTGAAGLAVRLAPTAATYAASGQVVAVASATDLGTLYCAASKVCRVYDVTVYAASSSLVETVNLALIKRSTANSGGTSAAATAVPYDSSSAAAAATVLLYSANPAALGTAVGSLREMAVRSGTTDFPGPQNLAIVPERPEPITLRGAAEGIAINRSGLSPATISSALVFNFVWTEEAQ